MSDARQRYSSRRFWVVMVAMGMSYHLALASKLTPPWATVVSVCVGAYALVRGYTAGKEADVEIAKAQSPADQLADAEEG